MSRSTLDDVIISICKSKDSQDKIIVTSNEISSELEINFDTIVHPKTISRMGVCKDGYYDKKYPDICSYNNYGDTRFRGLVVKRQKFLDEVGS